MKRCVASVLQLSPVLMDPGANMEKAEGWLDECKRTCGADIVVLPESFTTGFTPVGGREELRKVVEEIPGPLTDKACEWARKMDMYIVFPTYERGPGNTIYNSASLVGPEGLLGVYRKTHPFPAERLSGAGGWTTPGTSAFCADTKIGRVGIVICYDGDFPELVRVTALRGAEIIARPSCLMRTFDQWELVNRARAYDNHVYWLAANTAGMDGSGTYCFGGSMIIHPAGVKLSQCRGSEEFSWAELDPDPLRTIYPNLSVPQHFDHIEDRNLASYEGIMEEGKCSFEPAKRIPYRR